MAFVASRIINLETLRAHCKATLPVYMQPATLVQWEQLPQNAMARSTVARLVAILAAL